VGVDVPVDSEKLLLIDFVNLKIKSIQSFRVAHKDKIYIYILIKMSNHMYMSIYVYTIFIKK
jgi:hypothetical protein